MNHGPILFLGVFLTMAISWVGMIVTPQLQLGKDDQVVVEPANYRYPAARPGAAQRGAQVYRANGCFYCHTQQVRQSGVKFDVVLVSAGTNKTELTQAIARINIGVTAEQASRLVEEAPKPLARGLDHAEAQDIVQRLSLPDAKIEAVLVPVGVDIERGWGKRTTVGQDYLAESVVMLGNLRIGPDLANIGVRQTNETWHLTHLYDPQLTSPGSAMPPYRYLFEKRKIVHRGSPDSLKLPEQSVPAGYEIVPKADAWALVAYLQSLQADAPLVEAPIANPPKPPAPDASTNQPSATAGSTNQPGTSPKP